MKRLLAIVVSVGIAALSASCGDENTFCTEVGCESAVQATAALTVSKEDLKNAFVSTCRNGTCEVGVLRLRPDATGGTTLECDFGPQLHGGCLPNDPEHPTSLEFRFHIDDATKPPSGDDYVFSVKLDGASEDLIHVEGQAHYQESRPNGEDCDPVCYYATIE